MIRSFYEYIFFNVYQWSIKVNGKDYYNIYSASLMMTLIICFNFTTLFSIIHIYSGWVLPDSNGFKVVAIGMIISIAIANYKYFSYRDRLLRMIERYKYKPEIHDQTSLVTGTVVFGSFLLLLITWGIGLQIK